jgi:hypothetical protein
VSSNTVDTREPWVLVIQIGMWTMYSIALILVMVVVMLNL